MQTRILTYILGCLNLLLVFLVSFNNMLALPDALQWSGRLHPMLLHFPLALLFITAIAYLFWPAERNNPVFSAVFALASFTAVISALSGLFLSHSGEYDPALLTRHKWLGTDISIIAFLLWISRDVKAWKSILVIIALPVLVFGGHYGAALTHGEDYLDWPGNNTTTQQVSITDSSLVYASMIQPILEAKCYSCHNEKKAKGQLIMTSLASLMKGGKDGPLWIAGDALNSHIVQRMQLSEEDKKHMPPRGKPQLSQKEKVLIELWIASGADTAKRIAGYPASDTLRKILAGFITRGQEQRYTMAAASASTIRDLNTPFCTVAPVAEGSPALAVTFTVRGGFTSQQWKAIAALKEQVVNINCANMPLKDEDLSILKDFSNLETLILSGTDILGDGLKYITQLPKLRHVAVSSTKVSADKLKPLASAPALRTVYCWNSGTSLKDSATLAQVNPRIRWDFGKGNDPNELVRLTPPQVKDLEHPILDGGKLLVLRHPMPGVQIRYTLDGAVPDSTSSPLYKDPVRISNACRLRAIATRPGWLTSDTTDMTLFVRSAKPVFAKLLTKPDSNYKLNGVTSLLDEKKGEMNNIRENWLGFHGLNCEASFTFAQPTAFREVVVSTLKKTGPHILPPRLIELWAGNDSTQLKKIASIVPVQPQKYEADKIEAQVLKNDGAYRYYKIKAYPVPALPKWHDSRGKKVWIFVDEIFFN